MTCRSADFGVLPLTLSGLRQFVLFRKLYVITAGRHVAKLQRTLGNAVEVLEEDLMIPGMTLEALRKLSLPGFPKGAGWYFQQLIKFAFCFRKEGEGYYLIWDADTIPLRPLEFFDSSGRMLFAMAEEEHAPYFENYRRLLCEDAQREFSFVAQHMIVQKSILREMLGKIEANFPGADSWAWKIMRNLKGSSTNLFSEYEMLGHYVKNNYPARAAHRQLCWLRQGALQTAGLPSKRDLERLGKEYDYAVFESAQMPLRRFVRRVRKWLK
jgi:hypothetical protein